MTSSTSEPPGLCYLDESRASAASMLLARILEPRGIAFISGEVGSGKTTLLRYLADAVNAIAAGGRDIAVKSVTGGAAAVWEDLRNKIVGDGRMSVLLIDDCGDMKKEDLQKLACCIAERSDSDACISVVCAGVDPDLAATLPAAATAVLAPLGPEETAAFLRYRLNLVGLDGRAMVPADLAVAVQAHTRGNLRELNEAVDRLLDYCRRDQPVVLSAEHLPGILDGNEHGPRVRRLGGISKQRLVAAAIVISVAAPISYFALQSGPSATTEYRHVAVQVNANIEAPEPDPLPRPAIQDELLPPSAHWRPPVIPRTVRAEVDWRPDDHVQNWAGRQFRPAARLMQLADRPTPAFTVDDPLRIRLAADREMAVHCYYQDATGAVTRIFPNPWQASARLSPETPQTVPAASAEFSIVLDRAGTSEGVMCLGGPASWTLPATGALAASDLAPVAVTGLEALPGLYAELGRMPTVVERIRLNVQPLPARADARSSRPPG